MNNEIPEQKVEMDWLNNELAEQQTNRTTTERKPALKIEENKLVEIDIDFTKPFEKWIDAQNGIVKKIIPCKSNGVEYVFFLNTKNPLYKEILEAGKRKQTHFKIMRTGMAKATKYILLK